MIVMLGGKNIFSIQTRCRFRIFFNLHLLLVWLIWKSIDGLYRFLVLQWFFIPWHVDCWMFYLHFYFDFDLWLLRNIQKLFRWIGSQSKIFRTENGFNLRLEKPNLSSFLASKWAFRLNIQSWLKRLSY
jgi:hypothetical protein